MTLVKDINKYCTRPVYALDMQVFLQFNQLSLAKLVSIKDLNIRRGDGLFPYCQSPVRDALKKLLEDYGKSLTINSAYRSVIAQTVLYNNRDGRLVAEPGKSDHQRGISLDVQEWSDVKDLMLKHGWEWTYGNLGDFEHFDWKRNEMPDIRPDTVKAFQILWNKVNPENQIKEDGIVGSQTLECINNSPAEGFFDMEYPRTLKLTQPIQHGKDVGELQLALKRLGFLLEKADEVFGSATDDAVKKFQDANSLVVDGIVSAEGETRKALKLPTFRT